MVTQKMKPQKILIVKGDKKTLSHLKTVKEVEKRLAGINYSSISIDEMDNTNFGEYGLVISIGGDGTFTRASNLVENQLILGVNSDPDTSEGALTSIDPNTLNNLEHILEGNFRTIQRERAEVVKNKELIRIYVLNSIFIGAAMQFLAARYKIKLRDREEEQRSSGVIISTGSGSTAWFKSAGGEPFDYSEKRLKLIVREPYFGKRVFKSTILKGEIGMGERIEFESMRDYGGVIVLDDKVYDFNKKDQAEIRISDKPLNVILTPKN